MSFCFGCMPADAPEGARGRRVAEIAQLRGLRHLDVFLAGDLAAMRRLTTRCEPPKQSEIRQLSERWRLWRSLAFVREPPVTQRGGSSQIW